MVAAAARVSLALLLAVVLAAAVAVAAGPRNAGATDTAYCRYYQPGGWWYPVKCPPASNETIAAYFASR